MFALVVKPPGVDWEQTSYPSGHATVTMATAMAASAGLALPVLCWPMALLVVVIAWSRVAFGAHFPLEVLAALVLGYVGAVLGVAFACASGLLPTRADLARATRITGMSDARPVAPPAAGVGSTSDRSGRIVSAR